MSSETMRQPLTYDLLKAKHREIRDASPINLALRVHRALSWLQRAEKEVDDSDAAFIFYWVAFNAAYAEDDWEAMKTGERNTFIEYFEKMVSLDTENLIYDAIWQEFTDSIKQLLNNRYVFQPFWSHHNQVPGHENWKERFAKSKRNITFAFRDQNTKLILRLLFDRLYVLRNQLVHGGATWNSSVNREQVQDGEKIMAFLVPLFIDLMMDNPDMPWGASYYPVVD
ncbi:MAG: HEPN domain-containing protein [Proteobacteria bacterium]|nr:HEPN domain-containing protein [Pseudomonadota bacterium]